MIARTKISFLTIQKRSSRRYFVVGYWLFIVAVCVAFAIGLQRHDYSFRLNDVYVLVFFPALLGGVRSGGVVKPFRGTWFIPIQERGDLHTLFGPPTRRAPEDSALDERETRLRDRVHFIAYTAARWLALALFTCYEIFSIWWPDVVSHTAPLLLFFLSLTLWSLPQSLILWNEPDIEPQ